MSAKVITVAQQKGGSGKSTLATTLAVAYAKQGLSVMLFDADPQGTTSHWHAGRKTNDIGLIATSGWRLTRDLAMASEVNDIIVIDTAPHAEMDIKVAIRQADLVVVPIQPSPADVWAVKDTMKTIMEQNTNCLAVMNRVTFRANITEDILGKLKAMDVPVATTALGNRVNFAAAMETGQTVLDGLKNRSAEEFTSLLKEISAKVGLTSTKKQSTTAKASPKAAASKPAKKKVTKTTKVATKKVAVDTTNVVELHPRKKGTLKAAPKKTSVAAKKKQAKTA